MKPVLLVYRCGYCYPNKECIVFCEINCTDDLKCCKECKMYTRLDELWKYRYGENYLLLDLQVLMYHIPINVSVKHLYAMYYVKSMNALNVSAVKNVKVI